MLAEITEATVWTPLYQMSSMT